MEPPYVGCYGLGVHRAKAAFGEFFFIRAIRAIRGSLLRFGHTTGFTFGGSQDGVSFGRYVNSVGEEQFPLLVSRTPGGANAAPRIGPVVLSEIHYNPKSNPDEFLELRNLTGAPVPLFDPANPTNTWRLNGASFNFPTNVTLPSNGCLLLVSDNPVAFRARFSVPAANFTITTLADADGDGMADAWETNNFGSTNVSASADADGDGMTNLQEFGANTDPNDPMSFLKLMLTTPGQVPTIAFGAASNRTYTLQFDDQAGAAWFQLADVFARSNNRVETIVDSAWTSNRIYRVVTPRQP